MNPYALLPLSSFLANLILACYIFYRNPKGSLSRLFCLYAFSVTAWSFLLFLVFASTTVEAALYWSRLSYLAGGFILPIFFNFSLVFTKSRFASRKITYLFLYLPTVVFGYLSLGDYFVSGVKPSFWGYQELTGSLFLLFGLYKILLFILSAHFCFRFYFKTNSVKEKAQAKLLLIAICIAFAGPLITQFFLPMAGFEIVPLANLSTTICAIVVAYAILKYGLLTITSSMAATKIIETMADCLLVADNNRDVSLANNATLNLLAKKKEDVIGRPLRDISTALEGLLVQVNKKGSVQGYETEILDKEKKHIPFSINASLVKDKVGNNIGFVFVMRNISHTKALIKNLSENEAELKKKTRQLEEKVGELNKAQAVLYSLTEDIQEEKANIEKKVEERTRDLQDEKTKLQASISSLSIGFVMIDAKNNILMINQSARNIFCASNVSPLTTVSECTLNHIEDELKGAIDLHSLINRCIAEKKVLLIKDVAFENRHIKFLLTPILEGSLVLGAVLLVEDITEAKLIERSRDEFFSIASHELRTPLTAIRGNTALIQQFYSEKLKDKDLAEMIADIHESSTRLISIVNDFLDTSRLELGKMEFKKEEVDIETLLNEVAKEYVTTGSMKKLYLTVQKSDSKLSLIIADRDKVKQIIINLIGNALKFTEKGGVTIKATAEKGFVKVLVSDTGKGISPESQNLLFRKFQQASESLFTRDSVHGTGLGLYISKMMAEGMGGEIKLESSVVDKGSVFSVSLPAKEKIA